MVLERWALDDVAASLDADMADCLDILACAQVLQAIGADGHIALAQLGSALGRDLPVRNALDPIGGDVSRLIAVCARGKRKPQARAGTAASGGGNIVRRAGSRWFQQTKRREQSEDKHPETQLVQRIDQFGNGPQRGKGRVLKSHNSLPMATEASGNCRQYVFGRLMAVALQRCGGKVRRLRFKAPDSIMGMSLPSRDAPGFPGFHRIAQPHHEQDNRRHA